MRVFRLPHESRGSGFRITSAARELHCNGKKQTPPARPPRGSRSPPPDLLPPPHPQLPTCRSAPRGQKSAPNCGTAWCRRALRSQAGHAELAERPGPRAPCPAPPHPAPASRAPGGQPGSPCPPARHWARATHGAGLASSVPDTVFPPRQRSLLLLPAAAVARSLVRCGSGSPPSSRLPPRRPVRPSTRTASAWSPLSRDSPRQECRGPGWVWRLQEHSNFERTCLTSTALKLEC